MTENNQEVWRWPNFTVEELGCRHCGTDGCSDEAKDLLQTLRDRVARPLRINSAYRCSIHNLAVGGSKHSRHMYGDAFDIGTAGWTKSEVDLFILSAKHVGFTGFGRYQNFIHIDTGRPREWRG